MFSTNQANADQGHVMIQLINNVKHKGTYTFNNSTAERIISVCSYERFHSKQLENITKDHIRSKAYIIKLGMCWLQAIARLVS